jgi:hypothetical protein
MDTKNPDFKDDDTVVIIATKQKARVVHSFKIQDQEERLYYLEISGEPHSTYLIRGASQISPVL